MTRSRWLNGALLAALLASGGCKEAKQGDAKANATNPPATAEGDTRGDVQRGVGKYLPSVQRGMAQIDLQTLAKAYAFDLLNDAPPKKIEDLKDLDKRIVNAVKDGSYVVIWNVNKQTPLTSVIAYEKEAPQQGGVVAKLDGSAMKMSKQEFDAAPKAAGR
jgi:hypothetical protein